MASLAACSTIWLFFGVQRELLPQPGRRRLRPIRLRQTPHVSITHDQVPDRRRVIACRELCRAHKQVPFRRLSPSQNAIHPNLSFGDLPIGRTY